MSQDSAIRSRPIGATFDPDTPQAQALRLPAAIDAVSSLSEDTIFADHMLIASGENTVAMFANPFTDESEEMLFIGVDDRLTWARHSNTVSGGWELVDLGTTAREVVVVAHPTLRLFAFVLGAGRELGLLTMVGPSGDLPVRWTDAHHPAWPVNDGRKLSVQYQANRPGDPFVFHFDLSAAGAMTLEVMEAEVPAAGATPESSDFWSRRLSLLVEADLGTPERPVICGVDGLSGEPYDVRIFSLRPDRVLHEWLIPRHGQVVGRDLAQDVDTLAGLYNTSRGVGCVALRRAGAAGRDEIITYSPQGPDGALLQRRPLDHCLEQASVWQDSDGRAHVFGVLGDVLHVIHQVDLVREPPNLAVLPVWGSITTPSGPVATARPLVNDVAAFAIDPQPDEYPSQHVMHAAGHPAERCAIYTQDTRTTWWAKEIVRLPATTIPYKVTRYKTLVTVLDSFAGPMPRVPVTLTSSLSCDVEVLGTFYRVGPDRPVALATDGNGEITLKVVARSIAGHGMAISAKGLANGVSIDAAADVHNFLAGSGTLPNHPQGLTADGLHDAKTPDGSHVFPAWHTSDNGLAAVPTATEVMDWCRIVFSAQSGGVESIRGLDGVDRPIRSISIQTWDAERPAFAASTDAEQSAQLLAAARAHPLYAGFWDGAERWAGDFWQGLVDGVVRVTQTTIDLVGRAASIFVEWVDGLVMELRVVWDDIVGAVHFIESVFNSLLAKISAILDWLKWLFDLSDVMNTKDALTDALRQLPPYVTRSADVLLDKVAKGWFVEQEAKVIQFIDAAKASLTGVTLSPEQALPGGPQTPPADAPAIAYKADRHRNPHTSWMQDQLAATPGAGTVAGLVHDIPPEFQAAADALIEMIDFSGESDVFDKLTRALQDVGALFTNLVNAQDPRTLVQLQLVTMLDLVRDLVLAFLEFCEHFLEKVFNVVSTGVLCLTACLDLELGDVPFLGSLWQFICEQTGRPVSDPTLGDILTFAAAFPLTLISKAATGEQPFPDGRFPSLTQESARGTQDLTWFPADTQFWAPADYPVDPRFQAVCQMGVGLAQGLFTYVDYIMDDPVEHPQSRAEDMKILGITVADMIMFGVFDLPLFWGTDHVWNSQGNEWAWWAEYFTKLPIYLGDLVVAWVLPVVYPNYVDPTKGRKILGKLQGGIGQWFITILGLIETGFSITLLATSQGRPMDVIWMVTQLLSLVSSDTAVWRNMPCFAETWQYKFGLDAAADVLSGGWYFLMAMFQLLGVVGGLDGKPKDQSRIGEAYDSGPISRTSRQFPPYGFTIVEGELPLGLELGRLEGDDDATVRILGRPAGEARRYDFTLLCVNSYDPAMPITQKFWITVSG